MAAKDTMIKNDIQLDRNTLKDAVITTGNLKDGAIKSYGELRLKDNKLNSLILLHNMVMQMVKSVGSSIKKQSHTDVVADSTSIVPVN